MYKRKRKNSLTDDYNMEVQISKEEHLESEGSIPPSLIDLLHEIVRSGGVEFVERNFNPLGVSPLGNHIKKVNGCELAELDKFTTEADAKVKQTFLAKVSTITEQMKFLRQQLVNVLEYAQESLQLNHVPCNFVKVPGTVYHLYQRPSGQNYFSILSPSDWKGKPPHDYCGSYLYDYDFSWKKQSSSYIT